MDWKPHGRELAAHQPPETFPLLVQDKVDGLDPPADTPVGGSLGNPSPIQLQSTTPGLVTSLLA